MRAMPDTLGAHPVFWASRPPNFSTSDWSPSDSLLGGSEHRHRSLIHRLIHHAALEVDDPSPLPLRLLERFDQTPVHLDLLGRGRERVVGQSHLPRVYA